MVNKLQSLQTQAWMKGIIVVLHIIIIGITC